MKIKLSAEDKRFALMLGLLAMLAVWVYAIYLVKPLRASGGKVKQELTTARTKLRNLESSTSRKAQLQTAYEKLVDEVGIWRERMPEEGEISVVIERLSDAAREAGITIQSWVPLPPEGDRDSLDGKSKKGGAAVLAPVQRVAYMKMPLQVDAVGDYHSLGVFLNLLEKSNQPMHVVSLRIGSGGKDPYRHNIGLVIRAYFSVRSPDRLNGGG